MDVSNAPPPNRATCADVPRKLEDSALRERGHGRAPEVAFARVLAGRTRPGRTTTTVPSAKPSSSLAPRTTASRREHAGEVRDAEERARARPEEDPERDARKAARGADADMLDSAARHLAQLAPPPCAAFPPPPAVSVDAPSRARSLEELLPELVRRVAWAGDGKRGSVRLELGAGAYAGASVIVHADGGRVRVELGGLPDATLAPLRARIGERLRGHGLDVESVT